MCGRVASMLAQNLPSQPKSLSGLEREVQAHWLEHRPRAARALQQKGLLDQAVRQAVQQTKEAVNDLVLNGGMSLPQAWQLMREEWMYLPAETSPTFPQ